MSPVLCDSCESSCHDVCSCSYRDATCASMEKRINELTDKMLEIMQVRITEYSHCFNQNREQYNESDSSLGSPKPEVSLFNDFEPSCLPRPSLHDAQPLPSLEQEDDPPMSLSPALAPHSNHKRMLLMMS